MKRALLDKLTDVWRCDVVDSHDSDEMLDIVDENNVVVDCASKNDVHTRGLLHREVVVCVVSKGCLLLQFRADFPKYDHACAGHVGVGESYEECAVREVEEELGIGIVVNDLRCVGMERLTTRMEHRTNDRFAKVFMLDVDKDVCAAMRPSVEEVSFVSLFYPNMLRMLLQTNTVTDPAKKIIEKYVLN